jgi:hypothetical protein
MKKITALLIAIITIQFAFAQAYEGSAEYNKKTQTAILAEYKYPVETVEATLKDKLERQGLKLKSSKGYLIAYNTVISSITTVPMDYAFMVDKKSKREKETTVITLVINATGEINATSENGTKAKLFLNDLAPAIEATDINNQYTDQEKVLTKAQKKYKNLQDDQESMEKKKRNLEDDLRKNSKDQADQQAEVKRQQEILDAIRAKRK